MKHRVSHKAIAHYTYETFYTCITLETYLTSHKNSYFGKLLYTWASHASLTHATHLCA